MTATPMFLDAVADTLIDRRPRHTIDIEQYSPGYMALRLYGDFDMNARVNLVDAIDEIGPNTIVDIDLSGVTFLYSGAANILIDAADAAPGRIRLCAPHRPVAMIITALGAGHLLEHRTDAA
jgi:anti-anti-sigma regulatory factor